MATREFTFRLQEAQWDFGPGVGVQNVMCFHQFIDATGVVVPLNDASGSWEPFIPGPVIRGNVDDIIKVTIQNRISDPNDNFVEALKTATTVHWHGVELANAFDGTPVTQTPIPSGTDFTYRFKLFRPGVFWYHPHWDSIIQNVLGAYGPIICEDTLTANLRTSNVIPHEDRTFNITLADVSFQDERGEETGSNHVPLASIPGTSPIYIRNVLELGGGSDQNFGDVLLVNGKHKAENNEVGAFNDAAGNFQQFWSQGARGNDQIITANVGESLAFYIVNSGIHRFYKVELVFKTNGAWMHSNNLFRLGGEGGLLVNPRPGGDEYGNFKIVGRKGRNAGAGANAPQPASELATGEFLLPASSRIFVAFAVEAGWTEVGLRVSGFSVQNGAPQTDEAPTDMIIAHFPVGNNANPDFSLSAPIGTATALAPPASLPDLNDVGAITSFSGCDKPALQANGVVVPTAAMLTDYSIELTSVQPQEPDGGPAIDDIHVEWTAQGPGQPTADNTRYVKKGDIVQWTVETRTNGSDHPWHKHGFSFQPIKMELNDGSGNYSLLYEWDYVEYLDTIYVPFAHRLTYRFVVEDRKIIAADGSEHDDGVLGRWLAHCHIFKHAHRGMMMNFLVLDDFCDMTPKRCSLITDRSHFSSQEIDAQGGVPTEFAGSFFVVLHGYRPTQLGFTSLTPSATELNNAAPGVTFEDANTAAGIPEMTATASEMHLEINDLASRQRITFEYTVGFTSTAIFPADPADLRDIVLRAQLDDKICSGAMVLFRQANPYMLDGPTHWLSADVRVFQIQPGQSQSGVPFGTGQLPADYLADFLATSDTTSDSVSHPFRQISENQQTSKLELSTTVGGDPVFNFAIARVHYQSLAAPATDVRVFFRMFTTAVTNMAYQTETYPVDNTTQLPTFGASATDVLTIPFFSAPRSDVATDGDTGNVKTLPVSSVGQETLRYFGAILDINQTDTVFTDPGDGVSKSVRDLITGLHQCLVAEINFGADPIPTGATPANNENLSQRNLAIVESDNPGSVDAHIVTHTFDLEISMPPRKPGVRETDFDDAHSVVLADPAATFDELIILWGDLPPDSVVTLFMPDLSADHIVQVAAESQAAPLLEKVDAHTIRCHIADISFVPLPVLKSRRIAGLLTIQLPLTVETGEVFKIIVRQHATRTGRVTGQFQLTIPVSTSEKLRVPEMRWLNVMRSIGANIKPQSRWFAIFERYLRVTEDRVRAFGADPDHLPPEGQEDEATEGPMAGKCRWIGRWVMALIALAVLLLGLIWPAGVLAAIGAVALGYWWFKKCSPNQCDWLRVGVGGLLGGAGLLAIAILAGLISGLTITVLALVSVAALVAGLLYTQRGC